MPFYFKKPKKMRWDYETPDKQEIVTDGTTLWI
ncbi:MAG TPA: outer membrane lipoprotein carrier protein LolA, partial [Thiotrichaceae bacterium]|nr:outer membrane lipoprotein carrier protein LolA [Thiotrichaceae bacterium]